MSKPMADPTTALAADADTSAMPADIAGLVERMHGCCVTLVTIGTPDALAAADAVCEAMDTMSAALQLASAAMAAVTPTEH